MTKKKHLLFLFDKNLIFVALITLAINAWPMFLMENANGCIPYIIGIYTGILGLMLLSISRKTLEFGNVSLLLIFAASIILIADIYQGRSDFNSVLILIVIIAYVKTQSQNDSKNFLLALIKVGLVTIYMIIGLQYINIIPSLHGKFHFTGPFLNGNQLAIYIGTLTAMLVTYTYIEFNGNFRENKFLTILIIVGFIFLIFLKCRSTYIGLFVVFFFLFRENIYKLPNSIKFMLVPVLGSLFYFIFQLKSISSLGRLYIWELSLKIFKENLFGVYPSSFQVSFMQTQAGFFEDSKNVVKYRAFAGQHDYVFFDLLQFFIEYGFIIGIIFIILLISSNFKINKVIQKKYKNPVLMSSYVGILFLTVCSLTNYVFFVPQLKFLGIILVSILITFEANKRSINIATVKYLIAIVSLIVISQSANSLYMTARYHYLKKDAFRYKKKTSFLDLKSLYPALKGNPRYLVDVAILNHKFDLNNIKYSISLLKESRKLYLHHTSSVIIAEYYKKINKVLKAEDIYKYEYNTSAKSGRGLYLLLDFYFRSEQYDKFIVLYEKSDLARSLLSQFKLERLEEKYKRIKLNGRVLKNSEYRL